MFSSSRLKKVNVHIELCGDTLDKQKKPTFSLWEFVDKNTPLSKNTKLPILYTQYQCSEWKAHSCKISAAKNLLRNVFPIF